MRVTLRAVRDLARNAGFTEEMIERHMDLLVNFTFGVSHRERKYCQSKLRRWVHSGEIAKPDLLTVLREEDEDVYETFDS